jgi:hypothetical protein
MRSELAILLVAILIATSASAKDTDRTLEAIEIEGEIAIPQVLFITSRDHPRYRDGLRDRYRRSALEVGREVEWPRHIRPLFSHPKPVK